MIGYLSNIDGYDWVLYRIRWDHMGYVGALLYFIGHCAIYISIAALYVGRAHITNGARSNQMNQIHITETQRTYNTQHAIYIHIYI